jgi:proton-dependent oligopeptide transporter, POT family
LIQYKLTERHLGTLGTAPSPTHDDPSLQAAYHRQAMQWMWIAFGVLALVVAAALSGVFTINAIAVSSVAGGVIIGVAIAFFAYVLIAGGLNPAEKRRIGVIAILFVFSAMFWSGFEQAGSSLNLFAERYTDRVLFGWEMPASWLQSVNPLLIIALAPIFGMLWIRLAQKNLEPSSPLKFAFGLILLGLGFVVMIFAARIAVAGGFPSPMWLVLTYLLHTSGELALSPVGLSAVTKLAPRRFVGQMMGIWFISISLGNLIAGRIAGRFDPEQLEQMPDLFLTIVLSTIGAGVVLAIASRPMRKWIGERE